MGDEIDTQSHGKGIGSKNMEKNEKKPKKKYSAKQKKVKKMGIKIENAQTEQIFEIAAKNGPKN